MTVGLMNEGEHGLRCHMMMNDKGMGLRKSQQTCVENEQTGGMMNESDRWRRGVKRWYMYAEVNTHFN